MLKYTTAWLAKWGVQMIKDGTTIKLYSFPEIDTHASDGWKLVREDIDINTWNMTKSGIMFDLIELKKRVDELEEGGGFVKRDELKSYVFKE